MDPTKKRTIVSIIVFVRYCATNAQTPNRKLAKLIPIKADKTVPNNVAEKKLLKF